MRDSLPGQRLSACTCAGEDHPGPDVTVGRGVPEIDIIEVGLSLVYVMLCSRISRVKLIFRSPVAKFRNLFKWRLSMPCISPTTHQLR